MNFGVMPTPHHLDVWPIQISTYLTALKASILQNSRLKIVWF